LRRGRQKIILQILRARDEAVDRGKEGKTHEICVEIGIENIGGLA